jgi:hypothetical protein
MISTIETRLRSYEVMGEPIKGLHNDADDLIVTAHRIRKDFVVLDWHGRTITVAANDLQKAIQNATNHG